MGGMQDKRREPGKGREEQQRPQHQQRPGQDPVHPEPGTPSRGRRPEEMERRREEDLLRDEHDQREDF
ncbi:MULTISPECIES: hypothetical protein [Streptomyces]|uniref:hypothetical protein n=1 Tax=Streptomyces TaxID=1883 RepID=UPI0004BD013B|nr:MULTISPECIES: hypothetical protein [Streptomyces]KJY18183.1 hypothetical protein VR43_26375 [Streptomyces sp. NRRL S-104]KOU83423.1 hypothetical protein ADK93_27120 [Streptomyces sp. XY58]KOV05036.1 hypothetical protein ADK89_20905 [Streptomyces sp. XY37]KOV46340.1 hypothetical protein ADK99_22240 [Streptomyces sp. MMG1064]